MAISCGGVWRTDNGGASWRIAAQGMRANYTPPEQQFDVDIQDPHRMAHCPSQPDVLWVQHHNGIFRTTDGGTSWQEMSNAQPSSFGFTVTAHPQHGETALSVPATSDETRISKDGRLVVTRTADGGRSYETLSRGLLQQHDYDLIYRHCLDVDAAGQRLALGSTTGNAFTSVNAGESCQRLDAQLPPVNCVRFG